MREQYPGRGFCFRCGMPWVESLSGRMNYHSTRFSKSEGCFPLCQYCWERLTPTERLPFYRTLLEDWKRYGDPDHNGTSWDDLWDMIEIAVFKGM